MNASFQFIPLPAERFAALFHLPDHALALRHHARRVVADSGNGFPCRVSLEDAAAGETLLLLSFPHLEADSPFRAAGPIYVRAKATTAAPVANEVPAMLRSRLLSVRAYDAAAMLRAAEVTEGARLETQLQAFLADEAVTRIDLHAARNGCFLCRVERA